MKNLSLLFFAICILFSCSKDDTLVPDNTDLDNLVEGWTLVKMTGQIPNSETTGADMEWQESYLLNLDGRFTKQRERDGVNSEASGTYEFVNHGDDRFLELTYDTSSEIIGTCGPSQTETLWLKSSVLLVGTWLSCDGPGLEYEKMD